MLRLLLAGVVIALGWVVASGQVERWTLYPFNPAYTPPPAGMSETTMATDDGETPVVWYAAPQPGKPVVLYFSGNAGNLANRTGRFNAFLARGYGVVAPAYRGSSGSGGKPSETALIGDAQAVAEATPGLVGPARLIYYGESLGSAVSLALAQTHPPAAIVLEAPFTAVADVAQHLYPQAPSLTRLLRDTWDSASRATTLTAPLLILHGTDDALIPVAMGRTLLQRAASADKALYEVPGAGHETVWQVEAQRVLYRFLERH